MKLVIVPGSMYVVEEAMYLFGVHRVNPGHWMSPVRLFDLTEEEAEFAVEYFKELQKEVRYE